jgi:hypothetical protein
VGPELSFLPVSSKKAEHQAIHTMWVVSEIQNTHTGQEVQQFAALAPGREVKNRFISVTHCHLGPDKKRED